MHIYTKFSAAVCTLLAAAGAQAVVRSDGGRGQALIFAYYTANGSNQTLLSLSNNSDEGRVVQLRVAEGQIGETALVFNVYLAGRDSWSGAIAAGGALGGAYLLTDDASCVHPPLGISPPGQPGRRMQPLYVADGEPGSPNGQARTLEGWVEAIEVASVLPGTPTDRAIGNIVPAGRNCAVIAAAWTAPNGYWTTQPNRDLANPRGGLSGYSAVINVPSGTYFGAAAVALDEFRIDPADRPRGSTASVVSHRVPTAQQHLGLDDAVTDPAQHWVAADLVVDNRRLTLTYPSERAVDAVSAVLAASELSADFDTRADIGATTSFIQLFPTKGFYTDPGRLPPGTTKPLPPFRSMYNAFASTSVIEREWLLITDRDGQRLADSGGLQFGGCEASARHPATAVAVTAPLGQPPDPLLATRFHGPMNQICGGDTGERVDSVGTVTLQLARPTFGPDPVALRPSREGARVSGLPVVATRLINYVNAFLDGGVLSNYSSALPMSASTGCIDAAGQPCAP